MAGRKKSAFPSRVSKPAEGQPVPKPEPKGKREPSWIASTTKVSIKIPDDDTRKRFLWFIAVGKYAWNWSIAEWQLLEARYRYGELDRWPSIDDVIAKWRAEVPEFKDVPSCVPIMSITKFANNYMMALVAHKPAPISSNPRPGGSFRIDKSLCQLSEDKKTMHVSGIGDIELDEAGMADVEWDKTLYVTFAYYQRKGMAAFFVKTDGHRIPDVIKKLTQEDLRAILEDSEKDDFDADKDGMGVTKNGARGNGARREDEIV